LTARLPRDRIEAAQVPLAASRDREGVSLADVDLFGPSLAVVGAGCSNAGRPRLPIRLMTGLLYLKHSFNLSDEELVAASNGAVGIAAQRQRFSDRWRYLLKRGLHRGSFMPTFA
jgi:Transposase domain (DUF772)